MKFQSVLLLVPAALMSIWACNDGGPVERCMDLSGDYSFKMEEDNGVLHVRQTGCSEVQMTTVADAETLKRLQKEYGPELYSYTHTMKADGACRPFTYTDKQGKPISDDKGCELHRIDAAGLHVEYYYRFEEKMELAGETIFHLSTDGKRDLVAETPEKTYGAGNTSVTVKGSKQVFPRQ